MTPHRFMLPFCLVLPLFAQGLYNNVDKPGDSICPRIEIEKDPNLAFGQRSSGTSGGKQGADLLGVAHHQTWHAFFPTDQRKDVSAFAAYGSDGKQEALRSLHGKIVVVAFWSYRCAPAAQMLMDLAQLYERREKFGFEILAVNFDTTHLPNGQLTPGGWTAIKTFQMNNRDFFQVHPMPLFVPGTGKEGASNFLNTFDSMPVLCLVDKEGRLASIDLGYTPMLVSQRLSQLIREEQTAGGTD